MKDADALIERILYLEGMPNLQRLGSVLVGETMPEKLQLALDLERDAIARLNPGIALCAERADNGSRVLLETILEGEEDPRRLVGDPARAHQPDRRSAVSGRPDPRLTSGRPSHRGEHSDRPRLTHVL